MVYLLTEEPFPEGEVIQTLKEKGWLNFEQVQAQEVRLGEVIVTRKNHCFLFGLVFKHHVDASYTRATLNKCLKILVRLVRKLGLSEIRFIRDTDLMNGAQTATYISRLNHYFEGMRIKGFFHMNSLTIPPVEERFSIIQTFHEGALGGHKGINKTLEKMSAEFYWKHQRAEVEQFVRSCLDCQKKKRVKIKTKLPMVITDTPARAFDKVAMDFHGPLESSKKGNVWILTILDLLTKWLITVPVKRATAEETAKALVDHLICPYGPPSAILTDQGSVFQGRMLEGFARMFKIRKYRSSAFHPQSNGSLERTHGPLVEYIKQYSGKTGDWDDWLPLAAHAHNTCRHETTGYTPFELVRGFRARTPSHFPPAHELRVYDEYLEELEKHLRELQTLAGLNSIQAKYRSKSYYDRKVKAVHFREGEKVYLINERKGKKHEKDAYVGPYEITRINYKLHNAEICGGEDIKVVSLDKLKRAYETVGSEIIRPTVNPLDDPGQQETPARSM